MDSAYDIFAIAKVRIYCILRLRIALALFENLEWFTRVRLYTIITIRPSNAPSMVHAHGLSTHATLAAHATLARTHAAPHATHFSSRSR